MELQERIHNAMKLDESAVVPRHAGHSLRKLPDFRVIKAKFGCQMDHFGAECAGHFVDPLSAGILGHAPGVPSRRVKTIAQPSPSGVT